jgi:Uma2 family endonuclease
MTLPRKTGSDRFIYRDYLTWPEDERWEQIEGIPCEMTPAPSRRHQKKHGVREFCLVHPTDKIVMVYVIGEGGKYAAPAVYSSEQEVRIGIFEDFSVNLKATFRD